MNLTTQHRCIRWLLAFDLILRRHNRLAVHKSITHGRAGLDESGRVAGKEGKHHD